MLAGREELLAALDAQLAAGDGPAPRTVALCGLGGAGKTSVAVEYAHRHLAEVSVAWQFAGDPDWQAARDLAVELGGLPLALEQAAAYMTALGDTLAGYLALFRHRRTELLTRGEPTGYSKTVASTWALAFDRLRQTEPGAAAIGLLRMLAFCAPEAIPLRLLLQPRPGLAGRLGDEVVPVLAPLLEDPLAAGDAVAALRRYSLVTPAADGSVSLHRLVQAVTVDQMPAGLAGEWQQAAAAVIEDAIPSDPELPETWRVCAALLPHAQAALADDSNGMARIAHYLGSSGNYAAAQDFHRRVVTDNSGGEPAAPRATQRTMIV